LGPRYRRRTWDRLNAEWVWYGANPLVRTLLWPLSLLYAAGWQSYRGIYASGLKRAAEPHPKVVVVGNLTVGGSGKTPVTAAVVGILEDMGFEVTIGASGYGAPAQHGARVAPEGPLHPRDWGDEPALLRSLCPGTPMVVGRDRVAAAHLAYELNSAGVLVMDDGLQHLRLATRVKLVLDDPYPRNPWCLPAGPYREPRANRRFADAILPGEFRVVPDSPSVNWQGATGSLSDARLLTAVARPHRVASTLAELAPDRDASRDLFLADHHPMTSPELLRDVAPGSILVTTEKDWVKLMHHPERDAYIWGVLRYRVRIEPAEEFREWLRRRLELPSSGGAA